ncbi:hypothetical protein Tco_1405643 [Tanacetum coccineum]
MPHEASPMVTSLGDGDGNLEITQLKNRVKTLEDNEKKREGFVQEDAPNTRGMDQGEDLIGVDAEKITTSAPAGIATASVGVATASGSFPTTVIFTTASVTPPNKKRTRASKGIIIESSQTTCVPFIITKGKGKEKMVESESTKKKKVQEQLDAQLAKELEYEFTLEEQLITKQGEKDAKIARD